MLKNSFTKVVFVLLIAVLVQAFLFVSTSVINTALASGGGSDSHSGGGSGGSSNNADADFTYDGITAINNGGGTRSHTFPSGNVGLTVGGGGGQTDFYPNGDGTYNTITYPPESNHGGSSDNNNSYGYQPTPPTSFGCPAGTTLVSGSCCPDQNIVTTTTGSGKGQTTTQSCNVPPPPPPTPPTATISQSKTATITGEAFTLSYGYSGGGAATSCVLQRQSATVTSNGGGTSNWNDNLSTPGNYNYRAQCYGPGGSSAWVAVDHAVTLPPPTVSLTADLYTVPYNTATNLRWTSQNAVACTASGAWSGAKAINGTQTTGNLIDLTTYFLQCRNSANESTSPAVVNIGIEYGHGTVIDVDPRVTRKNTPVTVTWDTGTSNPANCQIQTGSIILQSPLTATSGSLTHTVTGETIFTISCDGNHNNAEATVKVLPEFQET